MPGLWSDLDFSTASRPVPLRSVQACVRNSKGKTTRAILNKQTDYHCDVLKYITRHCKNLQYLEIQSGLMIRSLVETAVLAPNLTSLMVYVDCETTLDAVSMLLAKCRKLERAEFHKVFSSGVLATWAGDMSKLRCLTMTAATTQTLGFTALNLVGALLSKQCMSYELTSLGRSVQADSPDRRVGPTGMEGPQHLD